MRSTSIQEIHYRPDIDGLRAIAVLSVIGFHVAPNTIKGGFIGVDIFFVISGFLITSIILSDLSRSQFSFVDFYSRRIRRIFPALLLVMAAAYIFGWFALLAQELTQLSKHIVSGSLFISNLVLWNESGYFDNFVDRKLFLNLWSLGVEEQFYLFWPLILYAGMRFKASFLKIIISILLISFSWNIYQTDINASAAFYSPLTRFWELLIGAILGYFSFDQKYTAKVESNPLRANLCSLVGFLLITLGIFLIDKQRSFPGWWAMLPTIGAALIIWAGEKTFLNKHILGNRISVSIGLISYPLYLWHWPLLVYGNIINSSTPSYTIRIGLIALTFCLSIATYFFIEKPIRKSPHPKKITIYLIILSILLTVIAAVTFLQDGFVYREKNFSKISRAVDASAFPGQLKELKINGRSYGYGFQNSNNEVTTLFIGDSNVAHYYPRVNEVLTQRPNESNSIIFLVQHGCLPIPKVFSDVHQCNIVDALDIINANKNIKNVVIGSRWFGQLNGGYYYFSNGKKYPIERDSIGYRLALAELESFIKNFKLQDKKVFLLLSSPIGEELDPRLMATRSLRNFPTIISVRESHINLKSLMSEYGFIRGDLKELAKSTDITYIDPVEFLCSENICPAMSADGDPIYSDPNHLNPFFVKKGASFIDQALLEN